MCTERYTCTKFAIVMKFPNAKIDAAIYRTWWESKLSWLSRIWAWTWSQRRGCRLQGSRGKFPQLALLLACLCSWQSSSARHTLPNISWIPIQDGISLPLDFCHGGLRPFQTHQSLHHCGRTGLWVRNGHTNINTDDTESLVLSAIYPDFIQLKLSLNAALWLIRYGDQEC